eukprot:m.196361 g.196361  ORF g.196361 m.196361 type:complete len:915 (-) comp32618_c0_seq1:181-2925(-)
MEAGDTSSENDSDTSTTNTTNSTIDGYLDLILEGLVLAENPFDCYEDLVCIGHGGTAEVYKATSKSDEATVAIKKFRPEVTLQDIANELRMLRKCTHDHVNGYIEGYLWENCTYVVLELCAGSLTDILQLFKKGFDESEIAAVCRGTLQALDFLHNSCKVVHRDIKAGNLLLASDGKLLLADFGVSKLLDENDKTNTFIGSPYWLAPEVILAMDTNTYSFMVDVWSLGITLIELAETKPPNFDLHGMSACYRIASGQPPTLQSKDTWSATFQDFLSHCLLSNPEERWKPKQLLQHDFVNNISDEDATRILYDLLLRSSAVVKAVDFSNLKFSGLVVTPSDSPTSTLTSTPTSTATTPTPGIPEEANMVDKKRVDSPLSPTPKTKEAIPSSPSQKATSRNGTQKPAATPTKQTHSTLQHEAIPPTTPPPTKQTTPALTPKTPHTKDDRAIQIGKTERLKLPSQLAEERERATNVNSVQLKLQMKEITKLRKKHLDELNQMRDKLKVEFLSITAKTDAKAAQLLKTQVLLLKDLTKETEQESNKLQKQQVLAKKKVDDVLKKAWSHCRSTFTQNLKTKLSELKKEHKGFKESKQQISDLLDSVKTKEMSQFETAGERFLTLESSLLDAKLTKDVLQFNLACVLREFELREKHLEEKVTMEAEHRTGQRCVVERDHILQLQEKQKQQQLERHTLVIKQHEDTFKFELEALQKKNTSASKKLKHTLKKMPVMSEEVVAIFEKRSVHGKSKSITPTKKPSLTNRLSFKTSIPQDQKRELKNAKEEHVKIETVKLSEHQMRLLTEYRQSKELEGELLVQLNEAEERSLSAMCTKKLEEFDAKILKMKETTNSYIAMQKKDFATLREQKIKKPELKTQNLIASHESVAKSTIAELRLLYKSGKALENLRPTILDELSMPLH